MGMGERIKKLMEDRGLTAYELSMKTGLSQASLSRVINNNTNKLNMKNVELLANYFKVPPDWLKSGRGDLHEKTEAPPSTPIMSYEEIMTRLVLTNERLVYQNDELIKVLSQQSITINNNSDTINNLSNSINRIGELTAKKAGGGIAS